MSSTAPFRTWLRPSTDRRATPLPPPPPSPQPPETSSNNTNLTTCLYQTALGLFSLTWSRSFLGHSLHLVLHPDTDDHHLSPSSSSTAASFHLRLKPFTFWKKHGYKKLPVASPNSTAQSHLRLFWDLTKAKFGSSGPDPVSNFYIAAVVDHELILLVGDLTKQALSKTKPWKKQPHKKDQLLVLRRENVFGNTVYKTRAKFGGKNREITIDCSLNSDARLSFSVDKDRVLLIKRLKWKFRGNEKVEVDGVPINISWDVYNWLFQGSSNNGHAVFMFKFETLGVEEEENGELGEEEKKGVVLWKRQGSGSSYGRSGLWRRRMESISSSSSISMSSATSSGGGSSVMEWSSVEENELVTPVGFSLLVYAWRK